MSKTKTDRKIIKQTLGIFWKFSLIHKWYFFSTVLTMPLMVAIRSLIIPVTFANLIDQISTHGVVNPEPLYPLAGILLASYILHLIIDQINLALVWLFEIKVEPHLALYLFDRVSAKSMDFYKGRLSGAVVSQTDKFIASFWQFIDLLNWQIIPIVFNLIFMVVALLPISPLFVLILLSIVVVYTTIATLSQRKILKLKQDEVQANNLRTGQLSDTLSNILSVKSYSRELHERQRFAKFQNQISSSATKLMLATINREFIFGGLDIIIFSATLFMLVFGPSLFQLPISALILLSTYSRQTAGTLSEIRKALRDFSYIFGQAHEMTVILNDPQAIIDSPHAKTLIIRQPKVEFQNVTFRHSDAKSPIFSKFNLEIQPGEKIGIVGTSGSGKTSLIKALLRLSDVTSGKILIDGQDIRQVTQSSLRQNIAYVPQDTALFNRSIAENISYGKPRATISEIKHAATLAHADNFIDQLDQDYDAVVGERGSRLSGGQRQRLAIARAILKDAPILILDEATSALDSESEHLIKSALEELMTNRTSIVIAHRLSTVANLDRIIVLDNGEIIEQGSHQELLKRSGVYAKLWDHQSA